MSDIDDITKALAAQYSKGISIEEEKKPAPVSSRLTVVREPRSYDNGSDYQPDVTGGPKIFPSEKMELRSFSSSFMPPKRPQIMMSSYSDDDLKWMFETPVKRGWEFTAWLEVIGLPKDLHEKYDALMWRYASRAFLDRKKEAHQR